MSPEAVPPEPIPRSPKRSRCVYVPPPPVFIISFVAGVQLSHLALVRIVPPHLEIVVRVGGFVALAWAGCLVVAAPLLFLLERTTIIPHASSRSLVTRGPYRLTRNPMYLGLTVGQIGGALLLNSVWPLLLVAIPVWIMNAKVIPAEERSLMAVFGDEYRAYQARVGRWL